MDAIESSEINEEYIPRPNAEPNQPDSSPELGKSKDPPKKGEEQTCLLCMEKSPGGSALCIFCQFPFNPDLRAKLAQAKRSKLLSVQATPRHPGRIDAYLFGLLAVACPVLLITPFWKEALCLVLTLVIVACVRCYPYSKMGMDTRAQGYRLSILIGIGLYLVVMIADHAGT